MIKREKTHTNFEECALKKELMRTIKGASHARRSKSKIAQRRLSNNLEENINNKQSSSHSFFLSFSALLLVFCCCGGASPIPYTSLLPLLSRKSLFLIEQSKQ